MRRVLCTWGGLALLAACSTTPDVSTPAPDYIAAAKSCAIMMGGDVGMRLKDPQAAKIWFEINRRITDGLYQDLTGNQYRAVEVIVQPADDMAKTFSLASAAHQCNRLILVGQYFGKADEGKYFSFKIDAMHIAQNGQHTADGTPATTVGDYTREYRYPMTLESMGALHVGAFANQAFSDMQASGVLEPIH